MTLKELRIEINNIPTQLDSCEVFKSRDDEGNGYNRIHGIDKNGFLNPNDNKYHPESIGDLNFSAEEMGFDNEEWEELRKDPTNRVMVIF
jgi:hypothetical protein